MKKRVIAMMLAALMTVGAVGCADNAANNAENTGNEQVQETVPVDAQQAETQQTESASGEPKILKTAASFAYPSLDVHKEYYGWYTSIYGVSEALFKMPRMQWLTEVYGRSPSRTELRSLTAHHLIRKWL